MPKIGKQFSKRVNGQKTINKKRNDIHVRIDKAGMLVYNGIVR